MVQADNAAGKIGDKLIERLMEVVESGDMERAREALSAFAGEPFRTAKG